MRLAWAFQVPSVTYMEAGCICGCRVPGVVVHFCNHSIGELRQEDCIEFQAHTDCMVKREKKARRHREKERHRDRQPHMHTGKKWGQREGKKGDGER